MEDIERIAAHVDILNAEFDKIEKLEMDLGIYEIIAENGDTEFRERVEAIKRTGTVADDVSFQMISLIHNSSLTLTARTAALNAATASRRRELEMKRARGGLSDLAR